MIHLDTTYLVDLLREQRRGESGPARERARIEQCLAAIEVIPPDQGFPEVYGRLLHRLEQSGERIGVMDLLIATTAVLSGAALLTRNLKHFERVAELDVVSY